MRTQQERVANQGRNLQMIEGYLVKVYRPNRSTHCLDPWCLERQYQHCKTWK